MRKTTALAALPLIAALSLAACSDPGSTPASGGSASSDAPIATTGDIEPFDVSAIAEVPDIAAMVPQSVKDRGILRNGATTDYAPCGVPRLGRPDPRRLRRRHGEGPGEGHGVGGR